MSVYVYAITAADHPLRLDDLKGVGEAEAPLRAVKEGRVAAVVSDAPAELRAKRRDLAAHQAVLERLMSDGAVLPMRFGLVGPDDDQVAEVLRERSEEYTERLAELDGCVEYNLKVSQDEDDLLREVVLGSDEVRRLNDLTRSGEGTQDDRIALGELVAREVEERGQARAREIAAALEPFAVRREPGQPTKEHFFNTSFLVERGRAKEFTDAEEALAEKYGQGYEFRLHGPLPPYSFV
ncbi:GvpL/GvpF family gas vesicle protein [Streptomyces thermolineatus]|uniref:GvpL/GvpF family gas vesicle protein n=1 Tax=Streptomyces thermolineatus TaxID=44033 RepID=A0ABN3MAZ2_9ACTN